MNSIELAPTIENILQTLSDDVLKRNEDVIHFYKLLYSLGGYSAIALDGQWGSGKTFFVNQVILLAKALNKNTNFPEREQILASLNVDECFKSKFSNDYLVVYYDAWYNDNDEDPLLSVLFEICRQGNKDFSLPGEKLEKMGNILSQVFKIGTRIDLKEIVEAFKSHNKLAEYASMREYNDKITELLNTISDGKVLLFIDELDRCKPSYAVKLIENVKRYFNREDFICVYSLNMQQLQYTIKNFYGADFDAHKYLDRFFTLNVPMPEVNKMEFMKSITGSYNDNLFEEVRRELPLMYNFQLREILHFVEQLHLAMGNITEKLGALYSGFSDERLKAVMYTYIVPLVIALKIHDINLYAEFVSGKNIQPLIDLFNRERIDNHILRYFSNKEQGSGQVSKEIEDDALHNIYNVFFSDEDKLRRNFVEFRWYGDFKKHILSIVGCISSISVR